MPDSPVRPGPPIPPSLADAPPVEDAARPAARGPYGLPFPRARVTRPVPERRTPVPAQSGPATSGAPARRPGPVLPRTMPVHEPPTALVAGPHRIVLVALVIVLVSGALWLDRDRHQPMAGYGVIPQPGAASVLESGLAVGDPAPNFRLLGADGEIVERSGLLGQPVLVHFWTTWCLDCAVELPAMQSLSDRYGDGLRVIGIDVGEPAGRVEAAAERHGARYPMLLDRDEEVSRAYGVTTYPATILIDAAGAIVSIHSEPVTAEELEDRIDALP